MNTAGFVPFLLQDNLDLSGQQQQVIQAIDQDLAQLLRLPPQQFWQVVTSDDTLHTCLDSFLRFKRRCYDEDIESIQGSSDVLLQLSQRVFRVFWRMAHPQEQSTAAPAAKGQPPAPSASQVADLLYNKWLMDVPKMMDLAVLYAPGSAQLVQQLLHQLLVLQPRYAQDIFNLSLPLTSNLHELLESVKQLGDKVLTAAGGGAEAARKQLLPELAEAVSYFMDASLTLQALVECLPEAAALLLHPQHHGELLIVLAAIYSSTIPLLRRISQQPAAAAVPSLSPARIQRLQHCLECLVFHLLRSAFCTKQGALASGGPAAVAALAAAEGGPSGSSSSSSSSSSRPLPPGFGSSSVPEKGSGKTGFNPEIQGQELMNLLMLLAHPSEVGSHAGPDAAANLLAAVNHAHHLDVAVSSAVSEGLLALDDAQFDYFLALVDGDRQLLQQRQQQQQQRWTQGSSSSSNAISSTTQQAGGASSAAAGASSSSSSSQPRPAELASMVASVKELLPDYGDGFITAVLHHNSYNTEQTINCLLEGSLPPALQGLDHGLKTWSPPAAAGTPAPAAASSSNSSGLSWTGLAAEAAAAAVPQAVERIPLPSLTAAAAAGPPKAGVDRRTSRVLGAMSGKLRTVTKSIAQEMQFEYDDEYDDSFDDLMGPGNDGVCDIEGEDTGTAATAGRAGAVAAAAGGDEYADEPAAQGAPGAAARRPQQQQQQQQRGGRPPRKEKLWVLDGKVYNYKKEGAMEVEGQAGAHAALKAAQQAALKIHGLGPGGNVPLAVQEQQPQQKPGAAAAAASAALAGSRSPAGGRGGPAAAAGRGGGGRGGRGGRGDGGAAEGAGDGGGGGGGGRGRGRGSHGHKEQHKSAIANHHRRDRALQKQSKGML